jgi:glucan 1,4-alpha-glucosidase
MPVRRALAVAATLIMAGALSSAVSPAYASAPAPAPAPASDGPGALSHFGLARKDCVGTAYGRTSKVWFTVANGVLSDVYSPTVDNTNVETLQFVVTDGSSFTDLQTRDMTYTVQAAGESGMSCEVTSTARSGRYRLITTYLTDPDRNSVLARVRLVPLTVNANALRVYARLDPTVNGNGGGGAGNGGADNAIIDRSTGHPVPVAYDTSTSSNAVNRDYAVGLYAALRADRPFPAVGVGFAGAASDGLTQLDATRALSNGYDSAQGGNVTETVALDLDQGLSAQLAIGFASSQRQAVQVASASAGLRFDKTLTSFERGWMDYDKGLTRPAKSYAGLSAANARRLERAYYTSAHVLKASEDKTFPGAIVASLASPWGQAVSAGDPANTFFGSYREVFARDLYETFTGLLATGDQATARDTVRFLFDRQQQPDGSMPRNSLLNGKTAPDSFGTQLDETAYPILMAWQVRLTGADMWPRLRAAADFVVSRGPSFGVERWEEQSGYSPSTIASEIAGLLAAAAIADANHAPASARVYRATADDMQRRIKSWTVTTNGPLAADPYFIRLSKTGDPNAAISYNLGNGGPTLDQRGVVDAGFLELTRLGVLPPADADIVRSLPIVDATIKSDTASGPGWHRYNGDGYGDRAADGRPWAPSGQGTGHLWPVLSGERGEHALQVGDSRGAARLLLGMADTASGVDLVPEQNWELPDLAASAYGADPTTASIGFRNGAPAGSAASLTWSAAQFVRLAAGLAAAMPVEMPSVVADRYVKNPPPASANLVVTAPADLSAVSGSPVTVSGTSDPGARIDVLNVNSDSGVAASPVSTTAATSGAFSVFVPVTAGTDVLTVTSTAPSGATAAVKRTVVWDFIPGTVVFEVTDPDLDDNGPGNYAYPTAGDFHAGAFDLQRFQVIDSGDDIVFRVQTRDLTPTFGSPLGAQLVDVYVHDPGAAPGDTSTVASFPQRNYAIAAGSAWSRLIEVQGFGQRYVDAHGTTLGTVNIRANQLSRFITFSVPKASLGTPGAGWTFTVVLTGQDGFSPDQARGFAPTPQGYAFGVCANATGDPHCTVDSSTVPKAMDVLTPGGVAQSEELDYTVHAPVVVAGVVVP